MASGNTTYLVFTVLLASFCFRSSLGDAVAFLDGYSGRYLKPNAPSQLSREGYTTLQSTLFNKPAPFEITKALSEEVGAFLVQDVFQRPTAKWTVILFGATQTEIFGPEEKNRDGDPPMHVVQLFGSGSLTKQGVPSNRVFADCGKKCLGKSFGEGTARLGGSYREGKNGLRGIIHLPKCSTKQSTLQLDSGVLSLWAAEIGALWKDLSTNRPFAASAIEFESTLFGLYWIRREYGAASREFRFASCYTEATLMEIHRTLGDLFDGRVFTSVLMHRSTEAIEENEELADAMTTHGRRLLSVLRFSDSDSTTTVTQKLKRFSTNAAGYVIFLVLLFCSLGAIYAMANMDFTKDTLLYSQAKID